MVDDDDSVVPLSAQTRRPLDTALRQQRVDAWYPILDPWWVIGTFVVLGVIFVPLGFKMKSLSDNTVEIVEMYDSYDNSHPNCGINTTANANKTCEIELEITGDMDPPILVHYQIENFHQNHRNYAFSVDNEQLLGSLTQSSLGAAACAPLNILGDIQLNPCGLIANTFFNDVFRLTSGISSDGNASLVMIEDGIAWQSDIDYLYAQPEGFKYEQCPDQCDSSCCDGDEWSCSTPTLYKDGLCYRYYYPNEDTTRYLYETYPQISPIDGVTDEHFIVWMRIAALPKFRKLYGWINQPISAGTKITFEIENNWEVGGFEGRKSLILSTNNTFGGKNLLLGPYFYYVGFYCFAAALFFGAKQMLRPRVTGDKKYLQYKED